MAKLPERRNEITRKHRKNTAAVPKSPIRASAPTHTAEKPMNMIRLRRRNSRSSVAAPAYTKAIFTNSDGCRDWPAMLSQFFAPQISSLSSRFSARKPSAAKAITQRSARVRRRSRSQTPSAKKPASAARNRRLCFTMPPGVAVAATAKPTVVRNRATVSASKPRTETLRTTKYAPHSSAARKPKLSATGKR